MILIIVISMGIPSQLNLLLTFWKRIDGFIIDSLKKELNESNFYNRYNEYTLKSEDLSSMSWSTEADNSIA